MELNIVTHKTFTFHLDVNDCGAFQRRLAINEGRFKCFIGATEIGQTSVVKHGEKEVRIFLYFLCLLPGHQSAKVVSVYYSINSEEKEFMKPGPQHCKVSFFSCKEFSFSGRCQFWISVAGDPPRPSDAMMDNFWVMATNNTDTDLHFVVGQSIFPAHKFIIKASSPVLSLLLSSKPEKEQAVSQLYITDTDPSTFETFLKFLYTGKLDLMTSSRCHLLALAQRYQVDTLKDLCQSPVSINDEELASIILDLITHVLCDGY